ncbi:hypothetical protein OIU79_007249 [Salix purpurea]|uniref:Uncharacterized protein n=1 Tax=Salix purpurea TaxID=77065 RepID=A0A9Q0TXD8_SALPP|nr:hypothetical protein OIU79_007249 [Salix purpurea]
MCESSHDLIIRIRTCFFQSLCPSFFENLIFFFKFEYVHLECGLFFDLF